MGKPLPIFFSLYLYKLSNMKKIILLVCAIFSIQPAEAQCTVSFTTYNDPADNGNVYFHDTVTSSTYPNYYWDFGDGTYSWAQNPLHTYNISGVYVACLTITDSITSCSATYCDTVFATNTHPFCNAYFSYVWDSTGYSYLYDNSVGYMLDYSWNFGDGTSSTSPGSQYHIFPGPGMYCVCLTVTNPDSSCISTYCDTILITSCHADFNFAFDSTGNGCTFNSNVSGSADTYIWDFGDGTTSTLANPYHVFTNNGWFHVQLSVSSSTDSTCIDNHSEYIQATYICDANFTIARDSSNPFNYLVYLANYHGSPSTTYFWDFGDGTTSTVPYPTHTFPSASAYYVCLSVSDAGGCTDFFCDTINAGHGGSPISMTVVPPPPPLTTSIVQTGEEKAFGLDNYPNPFNESTTINYSISSDAMIEIYVTDLLGKRVVSVENTKKSAGNYTTVLHSDNLSGGMYLLQMKADNKLSTKKIIVSK
jgi:PKD repeat protein